MYFFSFGDNRTSLMVMPVTWVRRREMVQVKVMAW